MKEIDALQAVSGKARVTARGADGGVHASGRVIAYCDVPSVVIEREDGTRFSWRADLTEVAEEPVASNAWHYGPTTADPDPGKMWHNGCGGEVLYLEGGYICDCGQQWDDDDEPTLGTGRVPPVIQPPIKPGTARRLGLYSVLDLRPGLTITRFHLNPLDARSSAQEEIDGAR